LVETGFLTNPTEEEYLNSEKGQGEVANAITAAFKKYKDEIEK
jgi:N-acetylmuramoyl-L-alanine amidase